MRSTRTGGPLDDYVARPDQSYDWQEPRSGTLGDTRWVELRLVSQTWRGITWRHQLYLLQPANADGDVRQALPFIDGGRWKEGYDRSPAGQYRRLARRHRPSSARARRTILARLVRGAGPQHLLQL